QYSTCPVSFHQISIQIFSPNAEIPAAFPFLPVCFGRMMTTSGFFCSAPARATGIYKDIQTTT
ncbi:MAG TPA: hypothetical protein PLG52_08760, partial [Anaerolineales bacterium]|nr:hypothetical protein [Anaerolineales bacterium]